MAPACIQAAEMNIKTSNAKSEIKRCVSCINTALRTADPKMHPVGKNCIQTKYQKPHSSFLPLNSSEEQFIPPRKGKLSDVESKTLIRTDAQHLGSNFGHRGKNNLFSP